MIEDISKVNVVDRVDEVILSQYKESENLIKYIKCFVSPIQSIVDVNYQAIQSRGIGSASGYSLDKIGKTVGEGRVIVGAAASPYFGFHQNASALGLDEGIFFSYGDAKSGDLILSDPDFRNIIRARILKNTSGGKVEDIIKFCDLLVNSYMGGERLNLAVIQGNLSVHLMFHNRLSVQAKLLLSLKIVTIIAAGVRVTMEDENGDIEVVR